MAKNYSDIDIKDMRRRVLLYGLSRGLRHELAEEMAQEWLINVVVKGRGQKHEHAYVDKMRLEHSRNPGCQKNHNEVLDEQLGGGCYYLPEVYAVDCDPIRLRRRMGVQKVKLLRMMARGEKFDDRVKKMQMTNFTLHHMQLEIRREINVIFGLNLDIHRTRD